MGVVWVTHTAKYVAQLLAAAALLLLLLSWLGGALR